MKTRRILIVTSLLLALPASTIALAEPAILPVQRTLTDSTGRKIEVTILSKTHTGMRIRRTSDSKELTYPCPRFPRMTRSSQGNFWRCHHPPRPPYRANRKQRNPPQHRRVRRQLQKRRADFWKTSRHSKTS